MSKSKDIYSITTDYESPAYNRLISHGWRLVKLVNGRATLEFSL
jgi:hypothetical protein